MPNVARMYDYYLGGKDNFAADREAAEQIIKISREAGSDVREVARANRGFLIRAVRHLAEAGIRQFLDIGAGLPTQDNVHQVAQRVALGAKVVYVDNDPIVLVHARALLAGDADTVVLEGDLRDPAGIIAAAKAHLDFDRPIAVITAGVLHFFHDDAEVGRIIAALREPLVSGSHLVLSHTYIARRNRADAGVKEAEEIYRRTASGWIAWRDPETLRGYLDGLEILEPGIVPVQEWRNDEYEPLGLGPDLSSGGLLGVVARVP